MTADGTETEAQCVLFSLRTKAARLARGKGALPTIRLATILGLLATAALLGIVSATAGLGVAGWITGLATGAAATALLATARMRSDQPAILPADWVTLTRALLIAGVAGLVADSFGRPVPVTALVTLSAVALALDAVDGQVARRTGTATPLGARIDGEVDAFLILLLSIVVSQDYGSWVLAIGAARYALLLAGWLIPWLAAPLPPRYWRKVVAAVQGIVLTVAASGLLDRLAGMIAVAVALAAAGRVVRPRRDLAVPGRRRPAHPPGPAAGHHRACARAGVGGARRARPDRAAHPGAFVRIPVEGLVLVAVALVLPPGRDGSWPASPESCSACSLLVKILNMGFYDEVGRAFNPVLGWGDIPPAIGVVRDSIGTARTNIVLVALCARLLLVIGAITASAIHITTVAARHRRAAVGALAALTAVWALCAGLSLQLVPGVPVASTSDAGLAVAQVRDTQAALRDQRHFEQALRGSDPEARIPRCGPAHRVARQGCPHRLRRKLRAGRRPGHELLARRRRRPEPGHRVAGPRRLVRAKCLAHLPDLRRDQLAGPLHPAVGAVGRHRAAVCRARRQPPVHPQRRLRQGRLAHRRRRPFRRLLLAARQVLLPLR